MSIFISQPTANETPDSGQGGFAVTSPSNTGHDFTSCDVFGDGVFPAIITKTCRWFTFQSLSGLTILAIKLNITHSSSGSLFGGGGSSGNAFILQYTLNGGSNWITVVNRLNFNSTLNTTFSVDLPVGQDISQVQVRDLIEASAFHVGDSAGASATISSIQLEVTTPDGNVIVIM